MAGPAIRYAELARSLEAWHDVTLAAPRPSAPAHGLPTPAEYDAARPASLGALVSQADVVVAPPLPPALATRIALAPAAWIADLYNPEPFEGLLAHPRAGRWRRRLLDSLRIDRISYAARTADSFICAGERQRDMWLGYLAASRRVDSAEHERDAELRTLIGTVGAGVPDDRPAPAERPVARGAGLPPDARLVVWNGGLWPWLDFTLVCDAVARLRAEDPSWMLVVAGAGRPGREHDSTDLLRDARTRLDGGLHVSGGWTDYRDRADLLLEATVGVCAHVAGAESRFAERLRLLDLVWAGVPIVCTDGDPLAALVAERDLGVVVPPGDAGALAAALARVAAAGRASYADALAAVAAERRWSRVAAPLAERISALPPRRRSIGPLARALALRHRAAAAAQRVSRSVPPAPPPHAGPVDLVQRRRDALP